MPSPNSSAHPTGAAILPALPPLALNSGPVGVGGTALKLSGHRSIPSGLSQAQVLLPGRVICL